MNAEPREETITERVSERPSLRLQRIRDVKPRDLAIRFIAGAVTSVVSGGLTLIFGPRVGGVMLAFPAILAASLTLIEKQEDSADARDDARGAVMGACALAVFAVVAALTLGKVSGAVAILLATVAWFAVALLGYLAFWFK